MDALVTSRSDDAANQETKIYNLLHANKKYDYIIGGVCIPVWILLFSAGLIIPAKPYVDGVRIVFDWHDMISATLLHTYTNVALLTCIAGAIGGVSSRFALRSIYPAVKYPPNIVGMSIDSLAYRAETPFLSICRSFAVYLLYIAGVSIGLAGAQAGDDNYGLGVMTANQYLRMAGFLSSLGFVVGYDPTIFTSMITRFGSAQSHGSHNS